MTDNVEATEGFNSVAIVEEDDGKRKAGRPVGSFKVKTKDNGSFLRSGKHELDDIIKKTGKELTKMIDVLVGIAEDKTADTKERRSAAEAVVGYHSKAVEQRNKDEITRKIAEVRVRGISGGGSTEEDDDTPVLDFDNIAEEFRDNSEQDKETT